MSTFTQKVFAFTSARGNQVEVFRTKMVGKAGFWNGFGETTEAFAMVNGKDRVEVEAGATFTAPSRVATAGF